MLTPRKALVTCGTLCALITWVPDKCLGLHLWKRGLAGDLKGVFNAAHPEFTHPTPVTTPLGQGAFRGHAAPGLDTDIHPKTLNDMLPPKDETTPVPRNFYRENLQYKTGYPAEKIQEVENWLETNYPELYEDYLEGRASVHILSEALKKSPYEVVKAANSILSQYIRRPVDYFKVMHPDLTPTQLHQLTRGVTLFRLEHPEIQRLTRPTVFRIYEDWFQSPRLRPLEFPFNTLQDPTLPGDFVSPKYLEKVINYRQIKTYDQVVFELETNDNEFFLKVVRGQATADELAKKLKPILSPGDPRPLNFDIITVNQISRIGDYVKYMYPELSHDESLKFTAYVEKNVETVTGKYPKSKVVQAFADWRNPGRKPGLFASFASIPRSIWDTIFRKPWKRVMRYFTFSS